jgi:hypothetical protein
MGDRFPGKNELEFWDRRSVSCPQREQDAKPPNF